MASPKSGLRNVPRQKRSEQRITQILDAAECVVQRMGFEAFTTNHVALEAKISIGTLYHWFPDKNALTEGLTARHIERLADEMANLVVDEPGIFGPKLFRRLVTTLAEFVEANPAVAAIVRSTPSSESAQGTFRAAIAAQCELILEARVPGVPEAEKQITAEACATIALAFLCQPPRGPSDSDWREELIYILAAYTTGGKYPPVDDPAWNAPSERIPPPVRPGLARGSHKG